jgi:hypothetical protein
MPMKMLFDRISERKIMNIYTNIINGLNEAIEKEKHSMLDELLKEINEIKEYKKLYESQKKDKIRMSEALYELMMYKYNNISYEERAEDYRKDMCKDCMYNYYDCEIKTKLPDDIRKPISSDKGWIPSTKGCGEFKWS